MSERNSASAGASQARLSTAELRGIAQISLAVAAASCLLLGVAFLGRRIAGAAIFPLTPGGLLAAGSLAALGQTGIAQAWLFLTRPLRRWDEALIPLALPSLAALALGGAISDPASGTALLGYWLPFVFAAGWVWSTYPRAFDGGEPESLPLPRIRIAEESVDDEYSEEDAERSEKIADEEGNAGLQGETWSDDVLQQITRTREGSEEHIAGKLRGTVARGERTVSLHIAFCPPLASRPEISAELLSDAAGSVSVAQGEVFGARFDVRLSEAATDDQGVIVEFFARSTAEC